VIGFLVLWRSIAAYIYSILIHLFLNCYERNNISCI
jgi:hypothetical protein